MLAAAAAAASPTSERDGRGRGVVTKPETARRRGGSSIKYQQLTAAGPCCNQTEQTMNKRRIYLLSVTVLVDLVKKDGKNLGQILMFLLNKGIKLTCSR